jgi:F-type H+-transporting ATPase subunit epsilon
MADTFRCRLVTPDAELLSEPVTYASVPAWDGLMGFQPGRAPLVARLGMGELRLDFPAAKGSGSRHFFVDSGFLKMGDGELTILAEKAVPAERIIEQDAKAELAAAEARTIPADVPDRAAAQDRLVHEKNAARTKLRLSQTVKSKGI